MAQVTPGNGGNKRSESATRPRVAFKDERGEITNVLEEPIRHVAIITSKAGSVRGNHYHPEDEQYVYVLSGSFESFSCDLSVDPPPGKVRRVFRAGDLVHTPPMVAHASRYLENTVCVVLTMDSREPKRFEEHTIRVQLI